MTALTNAETITMLRLYIRRDADSLRQLADVIADSKLARTRKVELLRACAAFSADPDDQPAMATFAKLLGA